MAGTKAVRPKDFNEIGSTQAHIDMIRGIQLHYETDGVYDANPLLLGLKKLFREEIGVKYFPHDRLLTRLGGDRHRPATGRLYEN